MLLALHRIFGRRVDGWVRRAWWIQDGAPAHRRIIVHACLHAIFCGKNLQDLRQRITRKVIALRRVHLVRPAFDAMRGRAHMFGTPGNSG